MNKLYYGDNLEVLRTLFSDESVDLIYLDPPFNSQASYNVLFRGADGHQSQAQVEAFEDSWHWGEGTEQAFEEIVHSSQVHAAELIRSLRQFLGENDMMAYLVMMAVRLVELHRVLKSTGTIYLHCDPTASHYLKLVLDAIFGVKNFRNEISWRRSNPKSHGRHNFANCRDVILRYTKSDEFTFNPIYGEHEQSYVEKAYRHRDPDGRSYRLLPLLNPNDDRPNLTYEFLGVTRVWRWTKARMQKAYEEGLVVQLKPGAVPQYKKYLEDSKGRTISNDWSDISPIGSSEELGYPTQKPVALLERVIQASSREGEIVLDPFCGCGTAIHAAEKLRRRWAGIDITHLSISLVERRLREAFPKIGFETVGTPRDVEGAIALANADKYQFQWWAVSLVDAMPYGGKKKGADGGIDGLIYFRTDRKVTNKAVVSVKGGAKLSVTMIRELAHVVERADAKIGLLVCLAKPTSEMKKEAAAAGFYVTDYGQYPKIQILTVEELLNGSHPRLPLIDPSSFKKTQAEVRSTQPKLF